MITVSVDDQINVAEEIAGIMKKLDADGIHEAFSDIQKALATVKLRQPDIAWLDIEMPGMSGLEMAMEIKKVSPATNIIFVTGHEKFAYQSFQLHASGFILKPATEEALKREIDNLRMPVQKRLTGVCRVQCFGNFEVFDKEDQAINFKRSRSKEVLAYLVDRRGAMCTSGEICGILFEDREDGNALKKQLRVFMSSLRDDLKKHGADEILVKGWNAYGVDCSLFDCDYYDYLKGESYAVNSFLGEYMLQYPWADMTLGELLEKPESF